MAGTRVFIAIDVEETVARQIKPLIAELSGMKFTRPVSDRQLHFTLMFFEDLSDKEISFMKSVMTAINKDRFTINVESVGFFSHRNDPQVVYIGIERSTDLQYLHGMLKEGAKRAGIRVDDREFSPHITLARVKSQLNPAQREALIKFRGKYLKKEFGACACKSMVLRKSALTEEGPVYSDLYTAHFGQQERNL